MSEEPVVATPENEEATPETGVEEAATADDAAGGEGEGSAEESVETGDAAA